MQYFNKNGIDILIKNMPKTPRIALDIFFKINKKEKFYGINSLLARLFLQGTKKYSSIELANEFEKECIDVTFKAKQDYFKISAIFLNEDYSKALELINELILNSTFDDFEKEVFKLKGEIISDLDNPRIKLSDSFIKEIYKQHPYSSSNTKILENLDKITKEDVLEAYNELFKTVKNIVLVGDFENIEKIVEDISNKFSYLKNENCSNDEIQDFFYNDIKKDKYIWIDKNDASQAQILQGWLVKSFKSEDCAKITMLSNILGSSGLSSRLFVNLRDKQGLAYNVRSQYETLLHSGLFNMYIGTAPKNIKKSLEGFEIELKKLADVEPTQEEMKGALENITGRIEYFTQNNSQISSIYGYNYIMGLGLNYNELFLDNLSHIKPSDVSSMARYLLSIPKTVAIIAPNDYKIDFE